MGKSWTIVYRPGRAAAKRPCRWLPRRGAEFFVRTAHDTRGLTARPFVGMCLTALWYHARGTRAGRSPDVQWRFPDVKKPNMGKGASDARHLAAMETALFAQHLPVLEHMAVVRYDDGDARQPGWIRLGTLGSAWTMDVKDPQSEMAFRLVDQSVDTLWNTAALLLGCEEAPWVRDPYLAPKGRQKKS